MKVIVYRMKMNKVALLSEKGDEQAFERISSKEVAAMNALAVLFYVTLSLTIPILAITNAFLLGNNQQLAVKANAPSAYRDVLHYRLLSTTLAKIQPLLTSQHGELNKDETILPLYDITPVIGLRPRRGVGFLYRKTGSPEQKQRCDCGINKLL